MMYDGFPNFRFPMSHQEMPAQLAGAIRRRRGCLGCLFQLALILAVGLVLGTVLVLGITALFSPWAFYLGGTFYILPYWHGWAQSHPRRGDYMMYVTSGT